MNNQDRLIIEKEQLNNLVNSCQKEIRRLNSVLNKSEKMTNELLLKISLLKQQLEAYENMRKEAIEYIKNSIEEGDYFEDDIDTDMSKASYDKYINSVDLLNILNKVGGSDE